MVSACRIPGMKPTIHPRGAWQYELRRVQKHEIQSILCVKNGRHAKLRVCHLLQGTIHQEVVFRFPRSQPSNTIKICHERDCSDPEGLAALTDGLAAQANELATQNRRAGGLKQAGWLAAQADGLAAQNRQAGGALELYRCRSIRSMQVRGRNFTELAEESCKRQLKSKHVRHP
jgi:hypothetical protein